MEEEEREARRRDSEPRLTVRSHIRSLLWEVLRKLHKQHGTISSSKERGPMTSRTSHFIGIKLIVRDGNIQLVRVVALST